MNVEINWQDSDSSSSKALTEVFPDVKVMVCGGHAARAHLKQLERLSVMKCYSTAMKNRQKKAYSSMDTRTLSTIEVTRFCWSSWRSRKIRWKETWMYKLFFVSRVCFIRRIKCPVTICETFRCISWKIIIHFCEQCYSYLKDWRHRNNKQIVIFGV